MHEHARHPGGLTNLSRDHKFESRNRRLVVLRFASAIVSSMVRRMSRLSSSFPAKFSGALVRRVGLSAVIFAPLFLGAGLSKNLEICAPGAEPTTEQAAWTAAAIAKEPPGTQKMAALLQKIAREADPMRNPFRSNERAVLTRKLLEQETDPDKKIRLRAELSQQLLNAGRPEDALRENEGVEMMLREQHVALDGKVLPDLLHARAMCYLRLGEQENCILNRNADSCLFPVQGGGVHKLPRGSRGAIAVLTELLEKFPGDLRDRWLLNIAYMTLGEYPAKVPEQWLVDPKLFESKYDIKRFPDIAGSVGCSVEGLAGGVVLEDFDNDGLLDLMVSGWGLNSQLRFFHNTGEGGFVERTTEAQLIGEVGGLNMIQCDYNNDGFMDVLVLRGAWLGTEGKYPCSLLRNNGDGTFTDVTAESGLLRFHPTNSAVWFDYNNDGWIDLFIANESKGDDKNPCELFRNNGNGTFTECAAENGVNFTGFFKAVVSADYNNDGRPDLFLSRLDGPKMLLRNNGPARPDGTANSPWNFTDVAAAANVTQPPTTFTCWFWDYDNDGWPDIMVNGYAVQDVGDIAADYLGLPYSGQRPKLYHNNGDGTFSDVTKASGLDKLLLTMGANFGDLDNDGWLDFYVGTGNPDLAVISPNRMFRNDDGKRFQDVTVSGGFGQLQKGHAIAFGDINNDGEQDVYSIVGGAVEGDFNYSQLFANPGHGNKWLKLKLEGVKTNRAAIGARIKVVLETDGGERSLYRTVGSGGSFGASSMRQEFGLGKARSIKRVEIFWPVTGATQVIAGMKVNEAYCIREDAPAPTLAKLKSYKWPAEAVVPPAVAAAPPAR